MNNAFPKTKPSQVRFRCIFEIKKTDNALAKKLIYDDGILWSCKCPLACAIKRSLGKGVEKVSVSQDNILVTYKSGYEWAAKTSKVLARKVVTYDKVTGNNDDWNYKPMKIGRHSITLTKGYT